MKPCYLRGVPRLSRRELEACRAAEACDPMHLAPRVAEIAREIRRRRPPNWAWIDCRDNPFAPIGEELVEVIRVRYLSGSPARVTSRELSLSIKTVRKWYRRCQAEGLRPELGRDVISLEDLVPTRRAA